MICPLFESCKARAIGYPEAYPAPVKRPALVAVREVAVAYERDGKVLVLQRGEGGAFAGMWELPRLDSREVMEAAELTPERVLFETLRIKTAAPAELVGRADATFTNHRIRTELFRIEDPARPAIRRHRHVSHKWVAPSTLAKLPVSRAQHRLFELLVGRFR